MKADPKIVEALQALLADELAAYNQYTAHAALADNWGLELLAAHFKGRAASEHEHAEELMGRLAFFVAIPIVDKLGPVDVKNTVRDMLQSDLDSEMRAKLRYNDAIAVCIQAKDGATRSLLEHILQEEDGHINGIETLQDQIRLMGLQVFISTQTKKA